jgi:hypothetical protein
MNINIIIFEILDLIAQLAHPEPVVLQNLRFVVIISTQFRSVGSLALKVMQVWDMMFSIA